MPADDRRRASAEPRTDLATASFALGDDDYVVVSFTIGQPDRWALLTSAERAVACLLVAGKSNREIAAARSRSLRTVANQVAAIYRKLGVTSRAELVANSLL